MKTSITNIFLSTFILISGYSMSQEKALKKETFNVESSVSEELITPIFQEAFKVRIAPNPTLNGKVKMKWPVGVEVKEIQIILKGTLQAKIIQVDEGQNQVTASNLQEGNYIILFIGKQKVLGTRKLKVIS